jgi:hypothetical protein
MTVTLALPAAGLETGIIASRLNLHTVRAGRTHMRRITRRRFLGQSAALGAAAFGFPAILRARSPNVAAGAAERTCRR